jgi:hypothetical protein
MNMGQIGRMQKVLKMDDERTLVIDSLDQAESLELIMGICEEEGLGSTMAMLAKLMEMEQNITGLVLCEVLLNQIEDLISVSPRH